MRQIMVDWMDEVCSEFMLRRETYHLAVFYIDLYLTKTKDVLRTQLQLVGVTSMYIACKVNEIYHPNVHDFVRSTDNGYTSAQILDKELDILKTLGFEMNPPTLNYFGNMYMTQWDNFYEANKAHPIFNEGGTKVVIFKSDTPDSYQLYLQFMTVIDMMLYDVETL